MEEISYLDNGVLVVDEGPKKNHNPLDPNFEPI